jgi:hypothetical protein
MNSNNPSWTGFLVMLNPELFSFKSKTKKLLLFKIKKLVISFGETFDVNVAI